MAGKPKGYKRPDHKTKLRYMRVLDVNGQNMSRTASELGISRPTLIKYKQECWNDYVETKEAVFEDSLSVEVKKLDKAVELTVAQRKLSSTMDKVIRVIDERLDDPELSRKISMKDLVNAINAIAPYVAEKRALIGADEHDGTEKGNRTNFYNQIIEKMQVINQNRASK